MAGQDDSSAFEGGLERDFYTLLDFDGSIADVDHQPVRIGYVLPDGRATHYTPDTLITYHPEFEKRPLLCEVKMRDDLAENWKDYRPRFKAAIHRARLEGWRFKIFTDREIRTPYLDNVKLLREYRFIAVDELKRMRLLKPLSSKPEASLQELMDTACPVVQERGPWLALMWHLLAVGGLRADLSQALSYSTRVSLPRTV